MKTTNWVEYTTRETKPQPTTNPKVFIAHKDGAQLFRQSGQVYVYPDATATCALFVCEWEEMEPRLHHLQADGWEVAR